MMYLRLFLGKRYFFLFNTRTSPNGGGSSSYVCHYIVTIYTIEEGQDEIAYISLNEQTIVDRKSSKDHVDA